MKTTRLCWLSFLGFTMASGMTGNATFGRTQEPTDSSAFRHVDVVAPAPDANGTFPYFIAPGRAESRWRFAAIADPLATARQSSHQQATWLSTYIGAHGARPQFDIRDSMRKSPSLKLVVTGSFATPCGAIWTPLFFDSMYNGLAPTSPAAFGCAPASGVSDGLVKAFLALDRPTKKMVMKSMTRSEWLDFEAGVRQAELRMRFNPKVAVFQALPDSDSEVRATHFDLH
jgi:hypothetical protein